MAKAFQRRLDVTSIVVGLLFGLTCATYLETTTSSDWATVYGIITSISRICALIGAYLSLVGLVLVARIPYVEKSVGHDRLVIWHSKLGKFYNTFWRAVPSGRHPGGIHFRPFGIY